MSSERLYRSATDRKLSGVCAGIAEYLEVDVTLVRILTVGLTVFTAAPVLLGYFVLAFALPEGSGASRGIEADWQPDGLRVAWAGPTVPFAVSWPQWLACIAAFGVLAVLLGSLLLLVTLVVGAGEPGLTVSLGLPSLFWPLAAVLALGGLAPRRWVLTVTHDALWVERPIRGARRVDLAEVDSLHHGPDAFTIHLRDGELLRLPPPPQDIAVDVLREQIERARRRALGHREDLEQAEASRQQLQALLAARERQER